MSPYSPDKRCAECGCPRFVTYPESRCTEHRRERWKQNDKQRGGKDPFYDSTVWRALRESILRIHPVCAACFKALASEVDHIIPRSEGGSDFDVENLQALCKRCHSRKTMKEMNKKKGGIVAAALAIFLMLGQAAHARPIEVTLFRVHSPKAASDAGYAEAIVGARWHYRRDMNKGLRIRQKHIYNANSHFWDPDRDLWGDTLTDEFYRWVNWGLEKRLYRKRSYGWMLEGATDPGTGYMYSWGKAFQGCSKNQHREFVATVVEDNGLGQDRIDYSSYVCAHELAHTLAASHVDDRSIMNTTLGSFYVPGIEIRFSPYTVEQIKRCIDIKGIER